MSSIKYLIFRYLTNAEFFNIYKPSGTEKTGGGQVYIDFPIAFVTKKNWESFFLNSLNVSRTLRKQGPCWNFNINSIGSQEKQELIIYQRRKQSICIAAQRITSSQENRVKAWHPDYGFPIPKDSTDRKSLPANLGIYILRTYGDEFWAGWFQNNIPTKDTITAQKLNYMLEDTSEGFAGFMEFDDNILFFDKSNIERPFYSTRNIEQAENLKTEFKKYQKKEKEIIENLFGEDESDNIEESFKEVTQKIRNRNARAVKDLKLLYKSRCQISNDLYTFIKKNGEYYSEAHHLIPLGKNGADNPYNIIIVSPLIHRMLHYANVSPIQLNEIDENNNLKININNKDFNITWHPDHAKHVKKYQENS